MAPLPSELMMHSLVVFCIKELVTDNRKINCAREVYGEKKLVKHHYSEVLEEHKFISYRYGREFCGWKL